MILNAAAPFSLPFSKLEGERAEANGNRKIGFL
jgi:hypothetical protein